MNFKNKTLWITGASSGIGRAFAIELSKKKCQLILSGRNKGSLDQVSKICKVNGSSVLVIPFDLSDENSINHAAHTVIDVHDRQKNKKMNPQYYTQAELSSFGPAAADSKREYMKTSMGLYCLLPSTY